MYIINIYMYINYILDACSNWNIFNFEPDYCWMYIIVYYLNPILICTVLTILFIMIYTFLFKDWLKYFCISYSMQCARELFIRPNMVYKCYLPQCMEYNHREYEILFVMRKNNLHHIIENCVYYQKGVTYFAPRVLTV